MTADKEPFSLGHRPALDGVRGLAIVLVITDHIGNMLINIHWFQGGAFGVDLFFVLSGFLITSILIEEYRADGRISIRSFYRRRVFRLFPALYLLLVVQLIYSQLEPAIHHSYSLGFEVRCIGVVVIYMTNWAIVVGYPIPYGLGHLWSLAVEEQFYLIWPIVLVGLLKIRRSTVTRVIIGVMILASAVSRAVVWEIHPNWTFVYYQTETMLDALLIGCGASYLIYTGWRPGRWINTMSVLALLVFIFLGSNKGGALLPWQYQGGFTLVAFAGAFLILGALELSTVVGTILGFKSIRTAGKLSYSIYLWHFPVIYGIYLQLDYLAPVERGALGLLITVVAAVVSYRFIEQPILRWSRKRKADALLAVSGFEPATRTYG